MKVNVAILTLIVFCAGCESEQEAQRRRVYEQAQIEMAINTDESLVRAQRLYLSLLGPSNVGSKYNTLAIERLRENSMKFRDAVDREVSRELAVDRLD